jgi:vesicle coat complex subunit
MDLENLDTPFDMTPPSRTAEQIFAELWDLSEIENRTPEQEARKDQLFAWLAEVDGMTGEQNQQVGQLMHAFEHPQHSQAA